MFKPSHFLLHELSLVTQSFTQLLMLQLMARGGGGLRGTKSGCVET